jgi:thiol-disulfide isomerase/thioredoxin
MKVLKFGAVWCPGCLVMAPRWQKIEKDNPWLETEYFDFDLDKDSVEKYKITDRLPVFIFQGKDQKELLRLQGEIDYKKLLMIIEKYRER